MSVNREVGLGMIGVGTIAEKELTGLKGVHGARLVAVADVNEVRGREVARRFGVPKVYTSHQDLLADPAVDAVIISTPNFLHAPHAIDAAKAGKHILVQKPMALRLADCDAMIQAAREAGVKLMTLFMMRFMPSYQHLKTMLAEDVVGTPRIYRTHFSHAGIYKSYKPSSDWFYVRERSGGGPLSDLGVHHFDLLRWLTSSEIAEIAVQTDTLGEDLPVENNALVSLRFKNGMVAQLFLSFATPTPPGYNMQRIEIFGTKGSVFAGPSTSERPPIRFYAEGALPSDINGFVDVRVPESDPWTGVTQHFVDCVREDRTPITTGEDGKRALEVILAGYYSAKIGRSVSVEEAVSEFNTLI